MMKNTISIYQYYLYGKEEEEEREARRVKGRSEQR